MDVALVGWPAEGALREELARQRRPRLLLVEPEARPPISEDAIEDWVRIPVSDTDLDSRLRGLRSRARAAAAERPVMSGSGTLTWRGRRLELSPHQARLVENLVSQFETVVSREDLIGAGWPQGQTRANTLDVHITRLRRRLHPLGLEIRSVRSRGYLLTEA